MNWNSGLTSAGSLLEAGTDLRVEVEPLQRVDDQRVLCQLVVHDGVEALQEGRRLDQGLVVGVVEALGRAEGRAQQLQQGRSRGRLRAPAASQSC